ncbi:hypothetical protein [Sinorhizobium sp. RAC02]|uniref:hypothetical protein n=1 Tax=Sinorhizobium sp. RAC02 TaxID=1842534 RepID=UPI00083E58D7|nr:hypothetical protein [Sinorhizobium sp. RAC02]AOF91613.1 hypothetical protein BSY16_199 [Sinorhizobium sp. RAC02]
MNFAKLWADYALYLPAPSQNYAHFAAKIATAELSTRLPHGIKPRDFDFLSSKNKLFHWPNALYSAAFAVGDKQSDMIGTRDRSESFVLGDSGGFSLISGAVKFSQVSFRKEVLLWQEQCCDVGIILDVPTRSLDVAQSGVASFDECLSRTKDNLKFTTENRASTSLRLLSVYQGRNHKEAKLWCDEISDLPLEGLAIAGHTRLDMWFWAKRFVEMLDAGKFDHVTHIHFLGTSQPSFAVLATALQRALRKYVRNDIAVSFDSSLGFSIAQRNGQITTGLTATDSGFRLTSHTLPARGGEFNPGAPFPYRGPLADLCSNGDFMPGTDPAKAATDTVGNMMISNHAVYSELSAILQANRLVDMAQQGKNSVVPYSIHRCIQLLDEAFAGTVSGKALTNLRKIMTKKPLESEDEIDRVDAE